MKARNVARIVNALDKANSAIKAAVYLPATIEQRVRVQFYRKGGRRSHAMDVPICAAGTAEIVVRGCRCASFQVIYTVSGDPKSISVKLNMKEARR